jgi:hypothetical protein
MPAKQIPVTEILDAIKLEPEQGSRLLQFFEQFRDATQPAPSEVDGQQLLPTPPVGWPVWWFIGADRNNPGGVLHVLKIDEPGRVCGMRDSYLQVQQSVGGSWHMSSPLHKDNRSNKDESGGWDWIPGLIPPDPYRLAYEKFEEKRKREERAAKVA